VPHPADLFFADLYGESAVGEDYRELDDRTVFQGNVQTISCPIALPGLFRLYAQAEPEIAFEVEGRRLRFTRAWTTGREGTAVLRGRIRYEIAALRAVRAEESIRRALATVTGDPQRIDQLRADVASSRPVMSSPALVEEATGSGVSWGCRGFEADGTIRIGRNEPGTGCAETEAAIRATLQQRLGEPARREQAQRAINERELAAEVNRLPTAERRQRIAELLASGRINDGLRAAPTLRNSYARRHAAWDIPGIRETGVYTPLPGLVIAAGRERGYGNTVRVLHDRIATPVITNYCHLAAIVVLRDQRVVAGLALGLVGDSGIEGQGAHLHFSVQRPGSVLTSAQEVRDGIRTREWFREVTGSDRPYAHRIGSAPR
jgi:murein DD-endopeptidase MepM/ murein hydrolase activator NlpD